MRTLSKILSGLLVSGLGVSAAFADMPFAPATQQVKITVDCPDIGTKGFEIVTNYGSYLAGPGIERVNSGAPTYPLFQGPVLAGTNIPTNLHAHHYKNDGVTYNPADGGVVCKYKTHLAGYDPFSISYILANATNGTVASSSHEQIHLKIPVGFKK